MSRIFYIFLLAMLPTLATAQISNLRSKVLPVLTMPQLLDTLTVVPNSVEVADAATGERISPQFFTLKNNRLSFDTLITNHQSLITVKYRVLPFNLAAPIVRLDTSV